MARELGFDSWPQLKSHIETLGSTPVSLHELVTRDDLQAMEDAVAQSPQSVNQYNESGPRHFTGLRSNAVTN